MLQKSGQNLQTERVSGSAACVCSHGERSGCSRAELFAPLHGQLSQHCVEGELPDWMADWDDDTDSDPPARCVFCEVLESGDSQSEPEVDELGAFNLVYVLRFPLWPFPELTSIKRSEFTLSRASEHVTELQVFCCSDCYDMLMQAHHESAEPLNLREVW